MRAHLEHELSHRECLMELFRRRFEGENFLANFHSQLSNVRRHDKILTFAPPKLSEK
jgi:hypothetical protein